MARCFAVLGASGVGKSTLVDQLVALEGGKAQSVPPTEARIARFKQPRRIFFADELPRNAMGKVQKAELRKQHAAAFGG